MASLVYSELFKYPKTDPKDKVPTFINKFKTESPFTLYSGSSTRSPDGRVILDRHHKINLGIIYKLENSREDPSLRTFVNSAKFVVKGQAEPTIKFSDLQKTSEFGSTTPFTGEDGQLGRLQMQLAQYIEAGKTPYLTMEFNGIKYKISDIKKQGNLEGQSWQPKADFKLIEYDPSGNTSPAVFWISHKEGKGPKGFIQYGGVSLPAEPQIRARPETESFISAVRKRFPFGIDPKFGRGNPVWRPITYIPGIGTTISSNGFDSRSDSGLIEKMSVYGNQYQSGGIKYGPQNVNLVMQGDIKITSIGDEIYTLVADTLQHFNGDKLPPAYQPVYAAWSDSGRSNEGIINTRLGIRAFGQVKVDADHII